MDVAPIVEVKKGEKQAAVAALPSRAVKRKTQEELALLAQYVQTTPGVLNLNGKNINDSEIKLFLPYFKVRGVTVCCNVWRARCRGCVASESVACRAKLPPWFSTKNCCSLALVRPLTRTHSPPG